MITFSGRFAPSSRYICEPLTVYPAAAEPLLVPVVSARPSPQSIIAVKSVPCQLGSVPGKVATAPEKLCPSIGEIVTPLEFCTASPTVVETCTALAGDC